MKKVNINENCEYSCRNVRSLLVLPVDLLLDFERFCFSLNELTSLQ